MRDHIVLDVFGSQVSLECGSYGHDEPTLRLTSLASLALAAPGEERGREVCRIAESFRREGVLFCRGRGGLHPRLPEIAGGDAQQLLNDSQYGEERGGSP